MLPPTPLVIHDAVVEILKDVSRRPIEPALESDLIADLGFDSLQVMETISALEDRFDISVPAEQAQDARTVAQIIARIGALVEARPSA
ncbi:MAG: acyl carrier protein [Acidobacteriota bacterium]